MNILFAHPNFPGQFKHLAKHFGEKNGSRVVFITTYYNKPAPKGVEVLISRPNEAPKNSNTHQYLRPFEKAAYAAQSMWRVCDQLKKTGFKPDIIYAHPGWGDCLLIKDIFPDTPFIAYMEFYYRAFGADVHFHPKSIIRPDRVAKVRFKNATNLLNLEACDWAISPTKWQASLHPSDFYHKFSVLHEGIDTELIKPLKKKESLKLPNGKYLPEDAEIITYVARNFEPYRGFEEVMRAISILMQQRPKAHFLIVGNDGVSYGATLSDGKTYKQKMLAELTNLDHNRLHWFRRLAFEEYIKILSHSMVHIYMTVPFVLSWSFLESMSMGCSIVASRTIPLFEVVEDGKNALFAEFFEPEDIAKKVVYLLDNEELRMELGKNAREFVIKNYDIKKILPIYEKLIIDVANGAVDENIKKQLAFESER